MRNTRGIVDRKTSIRFHVTTRSLHKYKATRTGRGRAGGRAERGAGGGRRAGRRRSPGGAACLRRTRFKRSQGSCRSRACMWPRVTRRPTERHPGRRCAARASGTRAAPGRGAEAAPHGPCEPASPGTQKPGRPLGRSGRGRGCCLQPRPASSRTASGPAAACGHPGQPRPGASEQRLRGGPAARLPRWGGRRLLSG